MAQSLSSVSYTNNNAAKDDIVGGTIDQDGYYTFTINSLLSNDPGGAAKLDLTKQFFFGEGVYDQQHQAEYMAANHIELVDQATGTYRVLAGEEFQYSVQIGNKGTWSLADVDVKDAPVAAPHVGGALFIENFDETPVRVFSDPFGAPGSGSIDLKEVGWTGTEHSDNFGETALNEVVLSGKFGPTEATSGTQFLDTQNTPGQINISHTFTDSTAAIDGKTATLSFDIGKFIIDWQGAGHYETNSNESFEFQIDGNTVASFVASQFNDASMHHFDFDIMASDYHAGTEHILSLVNTSDAASTIGFAIDSVVIHDWIV